MMEPYHESQNLLIPTPEVVKGEKKDEETNNGPLDFSLHRSHDCDLSQITLEDINSITLDGVSGQLKTFNNPKPRVKLTMRETPDQREKRLFEGRVRMKRLRSTESEERRAFRLQKARFWQGQRRQRERQLETPEQRDFRLTLARERIKVRRAQETPEERERRLKRSRERSRLKRAHETEEDRLKRLSKQRTNKRDRYHLMTKEEKTQLRQRERHCREKSTRHGTNIKYNEEEDLDSYFRMRQNSVEDGTNESMWVPEPEVCLSVEPSEKTVQQLNPVEEPATDGNYLTNENSLNLQEQISQHVSNLVSLKKEDTYVDSSMSRQFEENVMRESITGNMPPLDGFYVGGTAGQSMNSIETHKDGMLKRQGFEYMRMTPTIEESGFHSVKSPQAENAETINNTTTFSARTINNTTPFSARFPPTKILNNENVALDQGQYLSQYKNNEFVSDSGPTNYTPDQICSQTQTHQEEINNLHQIPQERYGMGN